MTTKITYCFTMFNITRTSELQRDLSNNPTLEEVDKIIKDELLKQHKTDWQVNSLQGFQNVYRDIQYHFITLQPEKGESKSWRWGRELRVKDNEFSATGEYKLTK